MFHLKRDTVDKNAIGLDRSQFFLNISLMKGETRKDTLLAINSELVNSPV